MITAAHLLFSAWTTAAMAEPAAPPPKEPNWTGPSASGTPQEAPTGSPPGEPGSRPAADAPPTPAPSGAPVQPFESPAAAPGAPTSATPSGTVQPFESTEAAPGAPTSATVSGTVPPSEPTVTTVHEPVPREPPPPPTPTPRLRLPPARFHVDLGPTVVLEHVGNSPFRALSDGARMVGGGAFVRASARLGKTGWFLGGGLSYRRSASDHYGAFGNLSSSLDLHDVLVVLRAAYEPLEGIQPFVGFGAGPSVFRAELAGRRYGLVAKDVTGTVATEAGLTFTLPRSWLSRRRQSRFTFGIEGAVGYQYRGPADVAGRPRAHEDGRLAAEVNFGELRTHAFTWRTSVVLRFL